MALDYGQRMAEFETRQAEQLRETRRATRTANQQRAEEAAGARGIRIDSRVTRKSGGEAGTVTGIVGQCSHRRSDHWTDPRDCDYRPRTMVTVRWPRSWTAMPLGQLVLAEAAS